MPSYADIDFRFDFHFHYAIFDERYAIDADFSLRHDAFFRFSLLFSLCRHCFATRCLPAHEPRSRCAYLLSLMLMRLLFAAQYIARQIYFAYNMIFTPCRSLFYAMISMILPYSLIFDAAMMP